MPLSSILSAFRKAFLLAAIAALLGAGSPADAAGTGAGTVITNSVTVNYQEAGVPRTATGQASFRVDRVVNITVTKLADASIAAGQANASALFLVSNTSNTALRFSLSAVSRATNTWTMNNVRLYRDTNNSGAWDAGDALYADPSTFGDILSGASVTVMIVADAPSPLPGRQPLQYDLVAAAVDPGTTTLTVPTAGGNTAGVDTVFADAAGSLTGYAGRDGRHSAAASFSASLDVLTVTKSVTVSDQWGGTQPIPGATLRYTITVTAVNPGTATATVISDAIPANTTYVGGTLKLNGAALTDASDTDAGDVGSTAANTVTVRLGNLAVGSAVQTITFDVRIN
jgi:uncharacterized repeat protein (TIGR01451 family)